MDQKEKTDIRSLNLKELTVFMEQLGEKAFRAKQIYQWLHGKQAASFEEMTNIPKALTPSEMLDQIYQIGRDTGERVSNVVVMGTGEPMDNFDNLLKFIELLTDENGLNISQRNVTVSTCGIVPRMRELADKKLQITLALSLHAGRWEEILTEPVDSFGNVIWEVDLFFYSTCDKIKCIGQSPCR